MKAKLNELGIKEFRGIENVKVLGINGWLDVEPFNGGYYDYDYTSKNVYLRKEWLIFEEEYKKYEWV